MKEHENKLEVAETIIQSAQKFDEKNVNGALEAFSADAELIIQEGGKTVLDLSGREAIHEHLASRFESIDAIFHNVGGSSVELVNLDQSAFATTSCIVKMKTNNPDVTTDEDVYYHDQLVKVTGFWYIVRRTIEIVFKSVH